MIVAKLPKNAKAIVVPKNVRVVKVQTRSPSPVRTARAAAPVPKRVVVARLMNLNGNQYLI